MNKQEEREIKELEEASFRDIENGRIIGFNSVDEVHNFLNLDRSFRNGRRKMVI